MTITFEVPGHPIGYYASGKHPNWTRQKQYHDYCAVVRMYAVQAGLTCPLIACESSPLSIFTKAFFSTGVHSDPLNVLKGVVDALFYSKMAKDGFVVKQSTRRKLGLKSGDKWTGGMHFPPLYDAENPRCIVCVTDVEVKNFPI